MGEITSQSPTRRKQFCVRFHKDSELRDLQQMASEDGLSTAAFLRWLAAKEKARRDQRRSRR